MPSDGCQKMTRFVRSEIAPIRLDLLRRTGLSCRVAHDRPPLQGVVQCLSQHSTVIGHGARREADARLPFT